MKKDYAILQFTALLLAFIALPLLLYFTGNFYSKGTLMEILSIVTILGFSLLLSQFFTSRLNKKLVQNIKMKKVMSVHKFIGYFFISLLLFHPLFIVIPKFFDNTVTPLDAFVRMLTTFSSTGIIMGLIAYIAMLLLVITSFFRFKMGLKYTMWRKIHGYLTIIFIISATWHAIVLGKHSNISFISFYIITAAIGIFYLLKTYRKP